MDLLKNQVYLYAHNIFLDQFVLYIISLYKCLKAYLYLVVWHWSVGSFFFLFVIPTYS